MNISRQLPGREACNAAGYDSNSSSGRIEMNAMASFDQCYNG